MYAKLTLIVPVIYQCRQINGCCRRRIREGQDKSCCHSRIRCAYGYVCGTGIIRNSSGNDANTVPLTPVLRRVNSYPLALSFHTPVATASLPMLSCATLTSPLYMLDVVHFDMSGFGGIFNDNRYASQHLPRSTIPLEWIGRQNPKPSGYRQQTCLRCYLARNL